MCAPDSNRPAARRSCVQYTSECAITSSVMSICCLFRDSLGSLCRKGRSVPNASECMSARTLTPCFAIAATTSRRLSSSAALMLKNSARRPRARISEVMRSTLGMVARRSRCTPKMLMPRRASSSAVASPKPEEAPRISAQPDSFSSSLAVMVFLRRLLREWSYHSGTAGSNRLHLALAVRGLTAADGIVERAPLGGQLLEHRAQGGPTRDDLLEIAARQRERPHLALGPDGRHRGPAGQERHLAIDVARVQPRQQALLAVDARGHGQPTRQRDAQGIRGLALADHERSRRDLAQPEAPDQVAPLEQRQAPKQRGGLHQRAH